ncbi:MULTISPECIES: HesA/MoeB/ThiF family protein [Flavobacteriaceae]|uniref:HesA/MoeB/ThiF family protein n=1 Tax=Flavobacteriaceae TaxID=49546 RepID=UPI001490A04C|nr:MULTISPECIES: HesA/MoeB/ThiF family protein [Allomuricauda]MDC6364668.1 HesA/MoeB/ThiF family protein [Muricauda sp. AC10]
MDNRYIRQTQLKDFGPEAQAKLSRSKVLVVGLGGLGLPALQYLNAMGVGTLGLMDQDVVELHNLQRQVLYTENDLGRTKLEVVYEKLNQQNSQTIFQLHDSFLVKENVLEIIRNYDVVVDATDNFPTRYLINDACVVLNKPFVYGALHGFEGHVSVFNHNDGPTYRCLYPNMPSPEEVPNCNDNGVLGVIPGIIGTLQALETVKVLTGVGETLSGKLLVFDGLHQQFNKIGFKGRNEFKTISKLQEFYESSDCDTVPTITVYDFQSLRDKAEKYTLIDVRTPQEFQDHHLEEATNIPLDQLELHLNHTRNTLIYVICQSGKRSEIAVKQLQNNYPELSFCHILGGMNKMMTVCH